ncbi:N-lysine methyltransferase KMT5A-like [Saccoglossus kowalevskii]|uniref:[histone H4]-lysine(20) N-methyltransferase n=1 Tax=Saccoglossus kowalevskii TaxID=10224 RepID=A0ABM0MJD5_SACKO|nr:PREDICTED: N-lysine methyltransferase SETD8-like [Saccoglossus kowalevskii]
MAREKVTEDTSADVVVADDVNFIKPTVPKLVTNVLKSPTKESTVITKYFPMSPKAQNEKSSEEKKDITKESQDQTNALDLKLELATAGPSPLTSPAKERLKATPSISTKPRKSRGKSSSRGRQGTKGKSTKSRSASLGSKKRVNKPTTQTSTLTDYFPVRRSTRRPKSEIKAEKQKRLQEAILSKSEDGLEIKEFENKGRGIVTTRAFMKDEFVIEYAGDLISVETAKKREIIYSEDPSVGCYMYYFRFNNKTYCVDATAESGYMGRLINHSKTLANLTTRQIAIDDKPYLIFVAKRNLKLGEELLYDYGDRSKTSLESHPWLSS